jgi:hypothetical protein
MRVVLFLTGLAFSSFAIAQPVLHNTGVDGSDSLVSAGAAASFWELADKPAAASQALGSFPFRYYNGAYFPDTATAAWVSPGSNGSAGAGGNYVYALEVDLSGLDPSTVEITGVFGTDNDGAIWNNLEPPAATTGFGGFGAETAFTLDSGWIEGINTIFVRVNNGGDPTAFYVRFDSAGGEPPEPPVVMEPAVPVPTMGTTSAIGLMLALMLLGAWVLRRS